jgi:hypothetical protein
MAKDIMKYFRGIFDDGLSRTAGIIFALVWAVVLFSQFSRLTEQHPLFGVFVFLLVPVLFILGGIVFVADILRMMK